jgi:hypothetical protein
MFGRIGSPKKAPGSTDRPIHVDALPKEQDEPVGLGGGGGRPVNRGRSFRYPEQISLEPDLSPTVVNAGSSTAGVTKGPRAGPQRIQPVRGGTYGILRVGGRHMNVHWSVSCVQGLVMCR